MTGAPVTLLVLALGPDPVAEDAALDATLDAAFGAAGPRDRVMVAAAGPAAAGLADRMAAAAIRSGGRAGRLALPLAPGQGPGAALAAVLAGGVGGALILLKPGEGVAGVPALRAGMTAPGVALALVGPDGHGGWALDAPALAGLLPLPEGCADSAAQPDLMRLTLLWRARLRLAPGRQVVVADLSDPAPPERPPHAPWPLCRTFAALADLVVAEAGTGEPLRRTRGLLWAWFLRGADAVLDRGGPGDLWTLGDQAWPLVARPGPAGSLPDPADLRDDAATLRAARALARLRDQGRGPAVSAWEGARLAGLHPGADTTALCARARALWAALGPAPAQER